MTETVIMQTLHDYMMATKAVEYVMAVVFLLGFVFFWTFLNRKPR